MKKTAISFGLLCGVIIIVYSFAVFLVYGDFAKMTTTDLSRVEMLGYLRYLILLLTIVFAIRHFKKQNGSIVSFKQLFLAGIYTALVVAVLVGLMEFVYLLVNPDFFEQYGNLTAIRLKEQGATAAELARHQEKIDDYKWLATPAGMGIFYFFETAVIGIIFSAIVALVLRTKRRSPAIA